MIKQTPARGLRRLELMRCLELYRQGTAGIARMSAAKFPFGSRSGPAIARCGAGDFAIAIVTVRAYHTTASSEGAAGAESPMMASAATLPARAS